MTKNEKIAISVSAVIGFALFCFVVVAVMSPLVFLTAYWFGDNTRFVKVEREQLPYALGEDYVFLSQNFFDEYPNLTIRDDGISVRYSGKRWDKIDTTFSQPIRNAQEYCITFDILSDGENDISGYFSCRKISKILYPYDNFSHGDYSYNIYEDYPSDSRVNFSCYATADSGSNCVLDVMFNTYLDGEEDAVKLENYRARCIEIFEKMLDNIVGYGQCIS